MTSDKIRVGIIGANPRYGWSMRAHLPALLALTGFELTAVCTSRSETAEESAKAYGAKMAFHDFHEMVEQPNIDLVSVSVRVPLHHEMVMAALEAGKHVFCEWPLGANLAQAQEMAALARSKGVRHMVGLQARGAPSLLRVRELLEEGYVGEVLACNMTMFLPGLLRQRAERAWTADRDNGANTLTIDTGHAIDTLCHFVGEFQEVSAQVATQVPVWEIEELQDRVKVTAVDNVMLNGILSGGVVASAHIARIPWHGTGWRMEVYGREGTLVASSKQMVQYANIRLQGAQGNDTGLEDLPIPDRLTQVPEEMPAGEPFNVGQMYQSLSQAIRGRNGVEPDFDLAVKRHRLLDVIQHSSDSGQKLEVT